MMNLFSKAVVAHQNGDVETARSIYMAILSRDPNIRSFMLAMIHLRKKPMGQFLSFKALMYSQLLLL